MLMARSMGEGLREQELWSRVYGQSLCRMYLRIMPTLLDDDGHHLFKSAVLCTSGTFRGGEAGRV